MTRTMLGLACFGLALAGWGSTPVQADDQPTPKPSCPVANAGDDQIAVVGHQVTLAGARSEPRGQIGYRWVQIGGPPVRLELEQGAFYCFVPEDAGRYRFALLVARGDQISDPDTVEICVRPGSTVGGTNGWPGDAIGPREDLSLRLADQVRSSMSALPEGPGLAPGLAMVFDRIGDRMELYTSYSEAFNELSRQLDSVVPADPARRRAWTTLLFEPLTIRVADAMRVDGLDLLRSDTMAASLTADQKHRLASLFHAMASGATQASRLASR